MIATSVVAIAQIGATERASDVGSAFVSAHSVVIGLVVLWALLTLAIPVAAWRNAFDADAAEQAMDEAHERLELVVYTARALPERATAGTPAKELPAALPTLSEGI